MGALLRPNVAHRTLFFPESLTAELLCSGHGLLCQWVCQKKKKKKFRPRESVSRGGLIVTQVSSLSLWSAPPPEAFVRTLARLFDSYLAKASQSPLAHPSTQKKNCFPTALPLSTTAVLHMSLILQVFLFLISGNMAAFDMGDPKAVVSPGGVGFDINCGVRLLRTNLMEKDVLPVKEQLAQSLFDHIPVGVGSKGVIPMGARLGKKTHAFVIRAQSVVFSESRHQRPIIHLSYSCNSLSLSLSVSPFRRGKSHRVCGIEKTNGNN